MSEPIDHAAARERLAMLMAKVDSDLTLARERAGTVELDQNSVGRLCIKANNDLHEAVDH